MSIQNIHGGNLDEIERFYSIPKEKIIDFSGNINPLGPPQSVKKAIIDNIDSICGYPDAAYIKLRKAIAEYRRTVWERVITGNGSTELISLFIKAVSPKKAMILSPAYSEYEREVKINNGQVVYFPLKESEGFIPSPKEICQYLDSGIDLFIACNPNNPTSAIIPPEDIEYIAEHCMKRNIHIMIDETYMEFAANESLYNAAALINKYKNIFVVAGVSKFFAVPGLRLGYGLCSDEEIINKMNSMKDLWSVNTLASFAGEIMFNDHEYINKSRELINTERSKISDELSSWNDIKLYKPNANFFLIKLLNENISSSFIFSSLIKEKMLIRDASGFPFLNDRYIRFCIRLPEDNDNLLHALKKLICVNKF